MNWTDEQLDATETICNAATEGWEYWDNRGKPFWTTAKPRFAGHPPAGVLNGDGNQGVRIGGGNGVHKPEDCQFAVHARTALPSLVEAYRELQRERRHWARVAEWFAEHEPGTPVPDWCVIDWCNGEPLVDEEILVESEAAEAAKKE